MTTNRFGLDRLIPAPIKREVRQRCGFGCVICGKSIIDYEHFDPDFADATEHRAAGIALLCIQHHGEVTRGWISKATVVAANRVPKCRETGFSFGALDPAITHPVVFFAGNTLRNCPIPIEVHGTPLFLIEPPEAPGGPYRISATFFDASGRLSLQIVQNEWQAPADQWDCEFSGGRLTVRSASGVIALRISFLPSEGIAVEHVDMLVHGFRIRGDRESLQVGRTGDSGGMAMTGCVADGCRVGISLD